MFSNYFTETPFHESTEFLKSAAYNVKYAGVYNVVDANGERGYWDRKGKIYKWSDHKDNPMSSPYFRSVTSRFQVGLRARGAHKSTGPHFSTHESGGGGQGLTVVHRGN